MSMITIKNDHNKKQGTDRWLIPIEDSTSSIIWYSSYLILLQWGTIHLAPHWSSSNWYPFYRTKICRIIV